MNALYAAAKQISDFMAERNWQFAIIGGMAVQRWGEPRQTLDVDLTLLTGFGNEEEYIAVLLDSFASRLPDAADFAAQNRVLLLAAENGAPIDVSLGGLPFEERLVQRASLFAFSPECELLTCSAEDLIVLKAFAGRPRDWLDVESIVNRQDSIDWKTVLEEIQPLAEAKDAPETVARLEGLATQ